MHVPLEPLVSSSSHGSLACNHAACGATRCARPEAWRHALRPALAACYRIAAFRPRVCWLAQTEAARASRRDGSKCCVRGQIS